MIKPSFSTMTKTELRAYVIAHPDDQTAFHTFVDRFASATSGEIFDIPKSNNDFEQVESLIREKLGQMKAKSN